MNQLIYILSPSYSGSTLLTFLLGTHPDVATIGELKATAMGDVNSYFCSCGAKLRQCTFWQRVCEECAYRRMEFDLADFGTHFACPGHSLSDRALRARVRGQAFEVIRQCATRLVPACRPRLLKVLERNRILVEIVTELRQGRMFLDGSKDPVRLLYLVKSGYWDVKTIWLIRDGRGTASSYMKHHRVSMVEAASEWRRTQEECEQVLRYVPSGSWMRLSYENLCREPDRWLNEVFAFLGVSTDLANCDFRAVEQHILGNAMRLRSSDEVRLDEKWRASLSAVDLAAFDRLAGEMNRRYGYQ